MKILFIGDIMGRSGREALEKYLPVLKEKHEPDIVIVNGDNAAHGNGITPKMCKEIYDLGVDIITGGDHIWDQREILPHIQNDPKLLRPANFPAGAPGRGDIVHTCADGRKIRVIHALGRTFMEPLDDPFAVISDIIKNDRLGQNIDAIFIDFHAEATSEKMAIAHYFGGRVSAIIGSHTHIPTADAHVMLSGTAFQSDAGMTGDYNSVIGVEPGWALQRFTRKTPGERKTPAKGEGCLCGTLVTTNPQTGLAYSIQPIRMGAILPNT